MRSMPLLAYPTASTARPIPRWLVPAVYCVAVVSIASFAIGRAMQSGSVHSSTCDTWTFGNIDWKDRAASAIAEHAWLEPIARIGTIALVSPAYIMLLRCGRRGFHLPASLRVVALLALGLSLVSAMLPWAQRWSHMCTVSL